MLHFYMDNDVVLDIERSYLKELSRGLRAGEMTVLQAKESAILFLSQLPFADWDDLRAKLASFLQKYPALHGMQMTYDRLEEELRTKSLLDRMSHLMHDKKYDEVISIAKKG